MNKIQTPKNWILHTPLSPHFQLWDRSVCRLPARVPNCWRQLIHIQTPLWYESNYTENYQRIAPVLQIFPRSSFLVVASEAKVRHYECTLPSHLEFSFSWGHTVVLLATPYFSKQLLENAGGERKLETAVSASLSFLFLMHLHLHSYSKTKKMSWDFHTVKTQNVY